MLYTAGLMSDDAHGVQRRPLLLVEGVDDDGGRVLRALYLV
jgi:hypothetical protein